jgi:hypothetical protein
MQNFKILFNLLIKPWKTLYIALLKIAQVEIITCEALYTSEAINSDTAFLEHVIHSEPLISLLVLVYTHLRTMLEQQILYC